MKEYTLCSLLAALLVVAVDRLLNTRVLGQKRFWLFLSVMYGFMILVNGYLTWRPVVLYGERFFLGVRLGTIPVEDFVYGFALIAGSIVVWEYVKGRTTTREQNSAHPRGRTS